MVGPFPDGTIDFIGFIRNNKHRFLLVTLVQCLNDATLFQGIGCYEEKQKTLIYSVINSEAKRELLPLIRQIDPHAFINVVRTEELAGRFHDIPHD